MNEKYLEAVKTIKTAILRSQSRALTLPDERIDSSLFQNQPYSELRGQLLPLPVQAQPICIPVLRIQ